MMQVINDKGSSPIKAWVGTKTFDPKTGTMVQAMLTRDGPGGNEIPGAYKRLDAVMANQTDLVEVVHTLRAKLCVKGA